MSDSLDDRLDRIELKPGMEPLTPEEKEAFLARVRAQGRSLTSEEQYALFGPPPMPKPAEPAYDDVEEMEAAPLDVARLEQLAGDFFPELGDVESRPSMRLVTGVIFDFDYTLAAPTRPLDELMEEGARNAEAYMRSTGMDLPDDFYANILEARRFALEKSDEEQEEHIADDAMSFLLQFFGYPASVMDPAVLARAVDIFYAPEMTAWALRPGARDALDALRNNGFRLALMANYSADRVFQRIVDFLGIRAYFELCISSAGVEFRKPDPQFLQIALDHWDVMPYEVVVVGDSLVHDVGAGLELGALTVQVAGETSTQVAHDNEHAPAELRPDATIAGLGELPAVVRAWAEA